MTNADPLQANRAMFDDYYDKPAWWFTWRYDTQVKRRTCMALLRRGRVPVQRCCVFELGFGSGAVLFSFPRTCKLVGAEISASAIQRAKRLAAPYGFSDATFVRVSEGEHLPAETGSMDIAIASHVLEHVADPSACLGEMARILKPGGHLVVLVPIHERYNDPNHVTAFTGESCRAMAGTQGFTQVAGFENEYLYYAVESLYWSHVGRTWKPAANLIRGIFNFGTSWWPFWMYRAADRMVAAVTGLPPRQAALLFRKGAAREADRTSR